MKIGGVAAWALVGACVVVGGAIADDYGDNSFQMPRDVVSAATAFENYMQGAAAVDGGFANGEAVHRGLKAVSSYETSQLEEGMIAYGAIAALQDDNFVEGVDRAAGRGEARVALAERLIEDPFEATRIEGAAGAARRIEAALTSQAEPLVSAGSHVKVAAYSVQHQSWSKVFVPDAQGRLAEVKSLSASRSEPSEADNEAMMARVAAQGSPATADDMSAGYSAIEARALALAAEAVLGHARSDDRERLSPLLTETSSAQCLRMAKLNLYQCMAVAGPQYEDIFCMGQHAMYDTAQCVSSAAHGGTETMASASYSVRPGQGGAYQPLVAHHSLRIDPN
jgi:hypothetical protein